MHCYMYALHIYSILGVMTFNSLILLIGCKDLSTGWKSNNHKINLVENQLFYFLEKDFLNENQCHVLFFPRFTE